MTTPIIAELADAIERRALAAADARWHVIGTVDSFSTPYITATIDGASVTSIRRLADWTTPVAGDVALFAVVRGTSSVHYVGVGKIA